MHINNEQTTTTTALDINNMEYFTCD